MRADEFPKLFRNGQPRQFGPWQAVACGAAALLLFMALVMCPWSDLRASMPAIAQSWLTNASVACAMAACVVVLTVVLDLTRPIAKVPTAVAAKVVQVDDARDTPFEDGHNSSSGATADLDRSPSHVESESCQQADLHREIHAPETSHEVATRQPRSSSPNTASSRTPRERNAATIAVLVVAGASGYWWWNTSEPPIAPRQTTLREQLIAIGRKNDIGSMPFVIDSLEDPANSNTAIMVAEHILGVRYEPRDRQDLPKLRKLIHEDLIHTHEQLRRRTVISH
jgi:hypothetical protein